MKCLRLENGFGIANLQVHEFEPVPPTGREVLVRMLASSLNYRDLMMVDGRYNPKQLLPLIPNSDGVGEVVAVGPDVDTFKVGDRVCSVMNPYWYAGRPTHRGLRHTIGGPLPGMLTEMALHDQDAWILAPRNLTAVEAATLPCSALTAWSALVTLGNLVAGETVLLQGTGGVSMFALQIAKVFGASVMITSSSDRKLELAKKLGADKTHNYRKDPNWSRAAREWTGRQGVDHILEVGGAETMEQSLKAIAVGGTISVIGVLTGVRQEMSVIPILMQNIRLQGVFVGHRESYQAMIRAIEFHDLKPVVDSTYSLEKGADAFAALERGEHVGKIVVTIAD